MHFSDQFETAFICGCHLALLLVLISPSLLWTLLTCFGQFLACSPVILIVWLLPSALAAETSNTPFPDMTFRDFSDSISENFGSDVSLATVLTILFSILKNTDLVNLHARQQIAIKKGEQGKMVTTWMSAFVRCMLRERLANDTATLFKQSEGLPPTELATVTAIGLKFDRLIKQLKLFPFTTSGKIKKCGILKPVSYDNIEPVLMICPTNYVCSTYTCDSYALIQKTRDRDIPQVIVIQGTKIHKHAYVVHGECSQCKTSYYADHDRVFNTSWQRSYNTSARVLKIGQNLWVDRQFSCSVLNSMYSYHASASSITQWFNESFGSLAGIKINRRHIWQAFVQESVRMVSSASGGDLLLPENCTIDEVTHLAYTHLGFDGLIKAAENHSCSECSHPQRFAADAEPAMPGNYKDVNMVVVDGIVMGPTVSFFFLFGLYTCR